jgi:hypothetical protein
VEEGREHGDLWGKKGEKKKKIIIIIIIKSQKPENKQAKTGARCYR